MLIATSIASSLISYATTRICFAFATADISTSSRLHRDVVVDNVDYKEESVRDGEYAPSLSPRSRLLVEQFASPTLFYLSNGIRIPSGETQHLGLADTGAFPKLNLCLCNTNTKM